MNILVLNWRDMKHSEAGGAEVHFQELFKRLVTFGHSVSLITTYEKGLTKTDNIDGISIYRWGHKFIFNWEAPFLIKKILKQKKIDCIIDDVNKLPFFTPIWFPKIPTGVFFHHLFGKTIFELAWYPFAKYVLFMENISAYGYKNTPCCTVSPSTVKDLTDHGFKQENITIIENSVDTNIYRPRPEKKIDGLLVYAGRLKKYKNVSIVLEAIKILKEHEQNIKFIVAGTGDELPHLQQLAQNLKIDDAVEFPGFISEEDKINLLQKATIFINPSHKEGWGITNIEANACGTAVIANDAPGLRDSVKHNITGLIYKENDLNDLINCIKILTKDNKKRHSFEQDGRKWALSFSWDNSATKVEKWLTEKILPA